MIYLTMKVADIIFCANHLMCIALWAAAAACTDSNRRYTKPALFLHFTQFQTDITYLLYKHKELTIQLKLMRWCLLVYINMLDFAILGAFIANVFFNVFIKMQFRLQQSNVLMLVILVGKSQQSSSDKKKKKEPTSVAGSNIFFSRRHSLGWPIGSVTTEGSSGVVGSTDVGKPGFMPGWLIAVPFTAGTPILRTD